jgi:two-component system phosphate regulon sensor histidine kinase PhoR
MINRMRISVGLMLISILLIVAFQFWWLRKTYKEEAQTLNMRTNIMFRETVHQLQVSNLKIDSTFKKTIPSESDMVGVMNVLKERVKDSNTGTIQYKNPHMVVAFNNHAPPGAEVSPDSVFDKTVVEMNGTFNGEMKAFKIVLGTDSLKDSVKIMDVKNAYTKALDRESISVPFEVDRYVEKPGFHVREFKGPDGPAEASIGFRYPITYRMYLRDTNGYLLKKISPQIFFSVMLLGITIVSFLSLYRNLRAQQKLAAIKNEFISNITHELKTPIATVSVAIEAMKSFKVLEDPNKTKEYLDISQNELQRLSLLVDKVLKLSMFEKKEIELKIETVDLKLLVEEVAASMRLQLEKHKAKLSIKSAGNTTVEGDRLHFMSVIFNLLDNALKYSKADPSIQIDINESGESAELAVSDNGIGIPVEYKNRIFEKFFRVPSGNTHNAKGYGLGLSYVAHVVDRHQGQIAVESQPGVGSTFTIKIPRIHG